MAASEVIGSDLRNVSMRHKRFGKLTIAFALSLGVGATVEGAIYRVDDSAPGGNGSSWPLAINNLQTALNLTLYPNDEIWHVLSG
jgi:hypothetical protein